MSELIRFRLSRAPQRVVPDPLSIIALDREPPVTHPSIAAGPGVRRANAGRGGPTLHAPSLTSPSQLVARLVSERAPGSPASALVGGGTFVGPGAVFPQPVNTWHSPYCWLASPC